jgi:hypothetical protein
MFTAGATLTLALAIGATGSVFGVVQGVLLTPFPYDHPDRVLTLWESNASLHFPEFPVSAPNYLEVVLVVAPIRMTGLDYGIGNPGHLCSDGGVGFPALIGILGIRGHVKRCRQTGAAFRVGAEINVATLARRDEIEASPATGPPPMSHGIVLKWSSP